MKNYQYIQIVESQYFTSIFLNRPEVKNAFHIGMIEELIDAFEEIPKKEQIRAIILKGKGNVFCAGADIQWMKNAIHYSYEENLKESECLAQCFKTIYQCPIPTIAMVHGAVMGGANGLMAACDFVVASEGTQFCFSEVKLGIIPATIAPYIIQRTGANVAKEWMMTGRKFDAQEAFEKKLITKVVAASALEEEEKQMLKQFKETSPNAVRATKKLIFDIVHQWNFEDYSQQTAKSIAHIRTTPEAQEGLQAFLDKRKPNWVDNSL